MRAIRVWLRTSSLLLPKPTTGDGRFIYRSTGIGLRLSKEENSEICLLGNVFIQSDSGDRGEVQIRLGRNAKLHINGDFTIGAGTFIIVTENAELTILGRRDSTGSGITSNTRIMVKQSMTIGADCIIAWDVFLTDCDWHQIGISVPSAPVEIGDRVWIARGATVLKGTSVGANLIIASGSVVPGKVYPSQSLIAGNPAKVVRDNVRWSREMNETAQ